jgi:NAD-dependent SIR2 family protein deacetylase
MRAKQAGTTLIEINPQLTAITPLVELSLPLFAGQALPQITEAFLQAII